MEKNNPDLNNEENFSHGNRRDFFKQSSFLSAITLMPAEIMQASGKHWYEKFADFSEKSPIVFRVNGKSYGLNVDPRVTLLDLLREILHLTGTKKGCDHGQCGACTVLVDGQRINSCLRLAVMCQNVEVTTVEGLAAGDDLHPMQSAFLERDAFQCGYCTPGQICSAVGLIREGHAKTDTEIREAMSGNICRCGAYRNILDAIKDVQDQG